MRITLIVLFVGICNSLSAQFCYEIWTIDKHKIFEEKINSTFVETSYFNPYSDSNLEDLIYIDQFPAIDNEAQIYKRNNDNFFPGLAIWLFKDKNDSVKLIRYNWSFYNPDFNPSKKNLRLMKKQCSRLEDYKEKYDDIHKSISRLIGDSEPRSYLENNDYYYKSEIWDMNDYRVALSMRFDKEIIMSPIVHGDWYIGVNILFKEK